jgi:succinyl-CoA synthetase alpha subunit
MEKLFNANTPVMVQGITGNQGSFHTRLMLEYKTNIVAGISPGKGGVSVHGVPVYDSVLEAQKENRVKCSIIFVPAPFVLDAVLEAIDGEIKVAVVITEHVPIKDVIMFVEQAKSAGVIIIGPNTPGLIVPGKAKLGIMPSNIFVPGSVGLASRSGTLTYEIAANLTKNGLGQSICLGVGGDPVVGFDFVDALKLFRDDNETKAVVLIGEIGGNIEELTAEYIKRVNYPKPIFAYIAGRYAPVGKRMGHAGAIVLGASGTAQSKIFALKEAGVGVVERPSELAELVGRVI